MIWRFKAYNTIQNVELATLDLSFGWFQANLGEIMSLIGDLSIYISILIDFIGLIINIF